MTPEQIDKARKVRILIAEDDDDDFLLTSDALQEAQLLNPVDRVKDGEELMEYLLRKDGFAHLKDQPFPSLILLDLNMPRKDGREALQEIKNHPELRRIPVVILTTSRSQEDILSTYSLGSNSFIRKPVAFEDLIKTIKLFKKYWIEIVELPD